MRFMTKLLAAVFLASVAGCAAGADAEREREAILAADREWAAAAAAGDVDRLSSYWTDDAVNFFPGSPPARGKAAILELVRQNRTRPGFSLDWTPAVAVVSESGDLGYTTGTFRLSALDSTGTAVQRRGNYVAIWRKQEDGSWKCEVESTIFGS